MNIRDCTSFDAKPPSFYKRCLRRLLSSSESLSSLGSSLRLSTFSGMVLEFEARVEGLRLLPKGFGVCRKAELGSCSHSHSSEMHC